MKPVIRVENVSKQYRLGEVGTGTISHDLNRWWHKVRGKPDPYLKIGERNDRTQKGNSELVWALKDINFEVKEGEVLGIIGKNGAGKSTLLKILSRITGPTTGRVQVKGRIASLLEVGTGFHPELTGRENVYLNGTILGMRKREVDRKLDEIVDFAGVERYLDTPVKRYSSGMMVRLGFAVAAHLDPEILIVDEVLAVGDAEFQKKCLGKMKDVSTNQGRTVLFVSHNMGAVKTLCQESILIINGNIDSIGNTDKIINNYLNIGITQVEEQIITDSYRKLTCTKEIEFIKIMFNDIHNECQFFSAKPIEIKMQLKCNILVKKYRIAGSIFNSSHQKIGTFFSNYLYDSHPDKYFSVVLKLFNHNLAKGSYYFALSVGFGDEESFNKEFDIIYDVLMFNIAYKDDENSSILNWPSDWGAISFNTLSYIEDG